ncbi:hypothetical protein MRX96_028662 [Rhipicephalus microplus]
MQLSFSLPFIRHRNRRRTRQRPSRSSCKKCNNAARRTARPDPTGLTSPRRADSPTARHRPFRVYRGGSTHSGAAARRVSLSCKTRGDSLSSRPDLFLPVRADFTLPLLEPRIFDAFSRGATAVSIEPFPTLSVQLGCRKKGVVPEVTSKQAKKRAHL